VHDAELDEEVAVKVFRPGLDAVARERLRREVRLGRTLSHARLVRMYELIEAGDRLAVTMEWVPGGTLAERLKGGPLGVGEAAKIAGEILEALSWLHGQGVVHRDVKPSNVLFDAAGGVRLADYGLARPVGEAFDLTGTALSVGTPGYMSPEQIRGEAPGPAADLYGLGATLFEMLAGRPPFVGTSAFEVARQHATSAPPDLAAMRGECPRWLARFVARLLEKRPRDRFADAAEARRALEGRDGRPAPSLRRARLRLAGAALAVTALALVAGRPVVKLVRPGESVSTAVEGKMVRGIGSGGDVVWARSFARAPHQVLTVDLEGDGKPETVVVIPPPAREEAVRAPAEILILDSRGRSVSSVETTALLREWPFEHTRVVLSTLSVVDLTGDGRPELVVRFVHEHFYPSGLAVYWPGSGTWETVLYHSGWIVDVVPVPGAPGRLRFVGLNNRMGFLVVEGELRVRPPEQQLGPAGFRSVYLVPGSRTMVGEAVALTRYTLGGEVDDFQGRLEVTRDGGSRMPLTDGLFVVDALGNPVPGPNAGRDLGARRLSFVGRINLLFGTGAPTRPAEVERTLGEIRAEAEPLLAEMPYRAVLGLVEARARALAGTPERAVDGLRRTWEVAPVDDVRYRLAHLEAISGDLGAARRILEGMESGAQSGRWVLDAPLLLLRVLIEVRDREAHREALLRPLVSFWGKLRGPDSGERLATFMARAHLLWDEVGEADENVVSWGIVPDADALAALARWRRGGTRADDPDRMRRLAIDRPDAEREARLALGAALLGLGRPREAVTELNELVASLEVPARDDFALRQTLDLARAIRLKALAAAGRGAEAAREGLALGSSLRPGLLPRILVEEVLGEAGPARGGEAAGSARGRVRTAAAGLPAPRLSSAP
jgi:serine/threonine-protein kinase